MSGPETTGAPRSRRAVASWILYDLANTIFSFVVVSAYLGPWLTDELGARDSAFAVPNGLSMLVVLFLAPLIGAISDRTRRVPFLVASTLVAVACTALLGLGAWLDLGVGGTIGVAVALFVVANIAYQLGLVVYDALLPHVTTPATMGRIGGWGVGIGYVGSFVGLAVATVVLQNDPDGHPLVFALSALAFLLFAVPIFVFVREPRVEGGAGRGAVRAAYGHVRATLRELPKHPTMARFLVTRILYAEAANTVIFLMGIYAVSEAGFDEATFAYTMMLGLGIAAAVAAAPLWGVLVDRAGPRNTLGVVLLLWIFTLLLVVLHPILALERVLFYPISALVGVCLGGTWTADRPLLVGYAPKGRVGEWFGLYAMAGRFAAVTGPLLYALIVDVVLRDHPMARPAGIFLFAIFMLASWLVLQRLPDPYKPDARPFAGIMPWGDGTGRPFPRFSRLPRATPFLLLYVAVTWALFLPVAQPVSGESGFYSLPQGYREAWTYYIPDLTQNVGRVAMTFFTAPLLNHDLIQLVYVTFLIAAVGLAFEAKEGWRRTAVVFVGSGFVGALSAGILLHLAYPEASTHPILEEAWNRTWSGGSAGAFGLMGAFAARARNPWFFLAIFTVWEINVGYWFLRSYTPAFHLTALATGFLLARFALKPLSAARPASALASPTK